MTPARIIALQALLTTLVLAASYLLPVREPVLRLESLLETGIEHPSDIIPLGDDYLVTELYSGKLYRLDSLDNALAEAIDAPKFTSPHFLDTGDNGEILVSEGWGQSVRYFDPTDAEWQTYPRSAALAAPHGVCLHDGKFYVADSLNSRLLRFAVGKPESFDVMPDPDSRVAYGRQLKCRDGRLWLANSFEITNDSGRGNGATVLRVDDFDEGTMEVVFEFPHRGYNVTGLEIISDRWIVLGFWAGIQRAVLIDLTSGEYWRLEHPGGLFGTPYGMYLDRDAGRLLMTYLGDIHERTHPGGIAIYHLDWSIGGNSSRP